MGQFDGSERQWRRPRWSRRARHTRRRLGGRGDAVADQLFSCACCKGWWSCERRGSHLPARRQSAAGSRQTRCDARRGFDSAAARLVPGVQGVPGEIVGIGRLGTPEAPAVGMQVIKAGAETGVTEGRIVAVEGDRARIRIPADYPSSYEFTRGGDSGAVWVTRDGRAPVLLHTAGNDTGLEEAFGVAFPIVLARLGLTTP